MNSIAIKHSTRRQQGLSLVELMISITIGFFLVLGVTSLIVQQSSTRKEMENSGRQMENGRYAMQLLRDDIQLAGYYGEYSPVSGVATVVPANPCDTTTANLGWNSATPTAPVAITGYTASDTAPSCVSNRLAGTAMLVVRRTDTTATTTFDGSSNYLQVSLCRTAPLPPFILATSGFNLRRNQNNCAELNAVRKYLVRIYYISSCNVCGTGGDALRTLKMVENGGAPTSLVDGIENMQFDYGIDADSNGSPDSYTATPTAANWPNVMAVRVSLLARNNDVTVGYTNTKTYSLGTVTVGAGTASPFTDDPTTGGYKRHLYSAVVRVANVSGRRETP